MATILRIPAEADEKAGAVELLAAAERPTHAVQFYDEAAALFESVGKFLGEGLETGEHVVVIATPAHRDGIARCIDADTFDRAVARRQLTMLDAHETLSTFMTGGSVDASRFRATLARIIDAARATTPGARIRAFGEMVDVLWRAGRSSEALRLEELWGEASARDAFTLLCAYATGSLSDGHAPHGLDAVCARHTHVLADDASALRPIAARDDASALRPIAARDDASALRPIAARDDATMSSLEEHVRALENELRHRRGLEVALREALRERTRVEAELLESVSRERTARATAEENDRFKEQFLAILGHDLRNPLNTILTTARLMIMRGELTQESGRRLERLITSGVRMQRMIEQILDVTCDRLSGGVPITREPEQDVAGVAATVVEEARLTHPTARIELQIDGACAAPVDAERLTQVVRTLVGNAIVHGSPDSPVRVRIGAHADAVRVEVHNGGPPIAAADRALLFEPFKRNRKSNGPSEGLGLGLYIAERIVRAHDGALELDSTAEGGTLFRVTLPRAP
ncbi:MAG: MEDS domain-containing protein [Labilithrix sp.]|nr:MEDS domain-containing protein [Labilithrix sp.]